MEGVRASSPVWSDEVTVADQDADLVVAPMDRFAATAIAPDGSLDLDTVAEALVPATSPGEPVEGSTISVDVSGTAGLLEGLRAAIIPPSGVDVPPEAQQQFLEEFVRPYLNRLAQPHQLDANAVLLDETTSAVWRVPAAPVTYDTGLITETGGDITDRVDSIQVEATPVEGSWTFDLPSSDMRMLALDVRTTDIFRLELQLQTDDLDLAGLASGLADSDQQLGVSATHGQAELSLDRGATAGTGVEMSSEEDPMPMPLLLPGFPVPDQTGAAGHTEPIPVAITEQLARASLLSVGDSITVQAWGAPVIVTISQIVNAVPGTTNPAVVLADSAALSIAFTADDSELPAPSELWVASNTPQASERSLLGTHGVAAVQGPGSVPVTDAAGAVRLVFWVSAAGAMLFAAIGIAAVGATTLAARRPEVAVLRALGMPPGAQARTRTAELGGVVLASVLLGLGAGLAVGWAVIPELARSTTLAGQAPLPTPLRLEWAPWAALLGLGAITITAILAALALRVRGQALQVGYREEIR